MTTTSCLLLSFDGTTWYPETVLKHKSYLLKTIVHPSISFSFALEKQKKKTIETNKKNFQLPVVTCRLLYQTEEDLSITTIYRYSNNSSFWSSTQSHEKKSYHYHYDNPCVIETILCFWATHLSHDHQHRKDCFFCFCFEFGLWYLCFFACK